MCYCVVTKLPDDLDGNYGTAEMLVSPKKKDNLVGSGCYVSPPEKYIDKYFSDAFDSINPCKHGVDMKKPDDEEYLTFVQAPVFKLGEILIIYRSNNRTIPDGRKPSKWDVEYEAFDDVQDAIERANEVIEKDYQRLKS